MEQVSTRMVGDWVEHGVLASPRFRKSTRHGSEARHRAEILGHEVYPEPYHKAAALLCELATQPSLEIRNLLFAATVTAAYLTASGLPVSPGLDTVLPLARAAREGLPAREVAAQLKSWTS